LITLALLYYIYISLLDTSGWTDEEAALGAEGGCDGCTAYESAAKNAIDNDPDTWLGVQNFYMCCGWKNTFDYYSRSCASAGDHCVSRAYLNCTNGYGTPETIVEKLTKSNRVNSSPPCFDAMTNQLKPMLTFLEIIETIFVALKCVHVFCALMLLWYERPKLRTRSPENTMEHLEDAVQITSHKCKGMLVKLPHSLEHYAQLIHDIKRGGSIRLFDSTDTKGLNILSLIRVNEKTNITMVTEKRFKVGNNNQEVLFEAPGKREASKWYRQTTAMIRQLRKERRTLVAQIQSEHMSAKISQHGVHIISNDNDGATKEVEMQDIIRQK